MTGAEIALVAAGAIGTFTAVVHGLLIQSRLIRPLQALAAGTRMPAPLQRLIGTLLHFSTVAWAVGGIALIASALCADPGARWATAMLVGGAFAFGAVGNLWATRGRHPGWMLMAVAVGLIAFALA